MADDTVKYNGVRNAVRCVLRTLNRICLFVSSVRVDFHFVDVTE